MENVVYARCGKESIVVLKEDGSVWWWGELNTGVILTGSEMSGLRFQKPTKVLEDAVFVTANRANMAAIKKDGSLWTWGHNSVGNCGTEIKNYIENPKKVLEDVKMVWFESMELNYSQTEDIQFIPDEKYKIEYDFTTFVEKKDNSIWACGMNVSGKDSEIRKIDAYGDVLCSPSFVQINMEEAYLYDRLLERLEDPEDLYWNYMDQKGEIQIGWALADNPYDASSGLTFQEFEEKYGTPVITYNRFDANNFINLMIEMRKFMVPDPNGTPLVGDGQLLYEADEGFIPNLNIRSFLDREYSLESYVELDLPDTLKVGNFRTDLTIGREGCLFEGDFEEPFHGEETPKDWYAPGGIEFIEQQYFSFTGNVIFEDGKLKEVRVLQNHSAFDYDFEFIEGCDMQAVLCEAYFDLFTAAEAEEYMNEYGISEEEFPWHSRYWYVFFAEEDSKYVYMLFLNQEYFDKEDIVELARSVKFRVK